MIKFISKILKINHYIKNLTVFVPLISAVKFFTPELFFSTLLLFVAFCLISSSVYIMNDIIDIEKDKNNPIKSKRPVASGELPKETAFILLILLLALSCLLSYKINLYSLFFIAGYFILNVFYSFMLQNIIIIDALSIALGFVFRILAGYSLLNIAPSPILILMTIFISMFFTFTKRKLELKYSLIIRKCLKNINEILIDKLIISSALLSIILYIMLTLDSNIITNTGTKNLYITSIPFAMIFLRLFILSYTTDTFDDPIVYFKDEIIKVFIIIYGLSLAIMIYLQ